MATNDGCGGWLFLMIQFNEAAIIADIRNEHLRPQSFGYCGVCLVCLHDSTTFGTSWRQHANKNDLRYKVGVRESSLISSIVRHECFTQPIQTEDIIAPFLIVC